MTDLSSFLQTKSQRPSLILQLGEVAVGRVERVRVEETRYGRRLALDLTIRSTGDAQTFWIPEGSQKAEALGAGLAAAGVRPDDLVGKYVRVSVVAERPGKQPTPQKIYAIEVRAGSPKPPPEPLPVLEIDDEEPF